MIYYFAFSSTGFLNIPRSIAPTIVPITTDNRYINGFPITGNTNIPPWGALSVQLKNIDNAPAVAEPITAEGITLNGSAAANGIAPSEINDNPIT